MDIYETFKKDNDFDLNSLGLVIEDSHFVDEDGKLWMVTCDEFKIMELFKNSLNKIKDTSFEYSTLNSSAKKNINRNLGLKLFSFTFFKYLRKRNYKKERVTIIINYYSREPLFKIMEDSDDILEEVSDDILHEVRVHFDHFKNENKFQCILCNKNF